MKKNSKPTKFLSAKTKVIKQKEDNMELMKNLRGSWIKICGEMSSQGFLCCSLFSGMDVCYSFSCIRYAFGVHLKVSAKIHEICFTRSV